MDNLKAHYSGFTLVEIAIVFVILSLLVGGLFKGQEMIGNAKLKRLTSDIETYRTAVITFKNKFNALPGDMENASTKLHKDAKNGDGNNIVEGSACKTKNEESCLIWSHLRYAKLIPGDPSGTNRDSQTHDNPFGGEYRIYTSNELNENTLKLFAGNIPATFAQRLDDQLDDGNAKTGTVSTWEKTNSDSKWTPSKQYWVAIELLPQ